MAVLESSLNKSAMARKFPGDVMYSLTLYEGMDINHSFYTQGITKMKTCVQVCAFDYQTGAFIKTSAEELMVEIGIPMTLGSID